ncbi:MAG: Rieske (2Fe-2S) protein, partial [Myxococcota bacterium]|nr:Rieske (2Fe-2S) protein [Myxococcota bacterium]
MPDAMVGPDSDTNWLDGGPFSALPDGGSTVVGPATVFHVNGQLFACENRCPHMGYPMHKGTIRDGVITCAWHRWEFDLSSGGCYRGACDDLRTFPVRVEDGRIQ